MKTLGASALILVSTSLASLGATAHCEGKHTGNHPHCIGDEEPEPAEYVGSDGVQFIPQGFSGFDYYIVGTAWPDNITAGIGNDLIEGGDGGDAI